MLDTLNAKAAIHLTTNLALTTNKPTNNVAAAISDNSERNALGTNADRSSQPLARRARLRFRRR